MIGKLVRYPRRLNHYDSIMNEAILAYEPFVILGWEYFESYGFYRVKYLKINGDMGLCDLFFLEDLEEVTE